MKKNQFYFFDACSGIGGGFLGFQKAGFKSVGYSEINKTAEKTYLTAFGTDHKNFGDLTKINTNLIPNFHTLVAGFPCQPFSILGHRKGVSDFRFNVLKGLFKIISDKKPESFLLENVKGLKFINGGREWKKIMNFLKFLNYKILWRIFNTLDFGLPQSRERIYIIGIRNDLPLPSLSSPIDLRFSLKELLIDRKCDHNFKDKDHNFLEKYLGNKYNNQKKINIYDLIKKKRSNNWL